MKAPIVFIIGFTVFCSISATAKELSQALSPDGKMHVYSGVARANAAEAAMDLIKVCLGNPLSEAGLVKFDGIENLEFTLMPDGTKTFAGGTCIFKTSN